MNSQKTSFHICWNTYFVFLFCQKKMEFELVCDLCSHEKTSFHICWITYFVFFYFVKKRWNLNWFVTLVFTKRRLFTFAVDTCPHLPLPRPRDGLPQLAPHARKRLCERGFSSRGGGGVWRGAPRLVTDQWGKRSGAVCGKGHLTG